jgi:hypothetical protein
MWGRLGYSEGGAGDGAGGIRSSLAKQAVLLTAHQGRALNAGIELREEVDVDGRWRLAFITEGRLSSHLGNVALAQSFRRYTQL